MDNNTGYFQRGYKYINEEISDPRTKDWPLVGSPVSIISVILFYLYFVRVIGPKIMKNRKPMNLHGLMIAYNLLQIFISSFIVIEIMRTYFLKMKPDLICDPINTSPSQDHLYNAFVVGVYFMAKIIELLDTVFFVLRKKWNQITPLHVWHHSGMVFVGWVSVKYVPGGQSMLTVLLNSSVHVVMYVYYLLMTLNPELRKSIWWKKHITQMQLIQFVLILIHHLLALTFDCGYPKIVSAWVLPHICFIAFLFLDFYRNAYLGNKNVKTNKTN